MSKTSKRRPGTGYADGWDRIFGKKDAPEPELGCEYDEEDATGKIWKWEISPHPYNTDYDIMVTDSDDEARQAILYAAELHLWDSNDGEVRILKVVHNVV